MATAAAKYTAAAAFPQLPFLTGSARKGILFQRSKKASGAGKQAAVCLQRI